MSHNTYANGREVSAKAADSKTIAAFPDVCFTPAPPPPGVPIPYPNTGFASDTANGSKTVKLKGKPAVLKNKSCFKTSTGDEAGSAPKKGVISSKIKGKIYFTSWSMDVKIEGMNVCRHLDMTTHNHGSQPGNSPTWAHLGGQAGGSAAGPCKETADAVNDKCSKHVKTTKAGSPKRKATMAAMCADDECKGALKCVVTPYSTSNCCDGKTPHHLVPKSQFHERGNQSAPILTTSDKNGKTVSIFKADKAPCICVDGAGQYDKLHAEMHRETSALTRQKVSGGRGAPIPDGTRWSVGDAEKVGAQATETVMGCEKECIEAQAREMHQQMGVSAADQIRPTTPGPRETYDENIY